ncbi:polysaccharide pyruvyl transferase family protein [Aquiluna sp.]|nr:polysaccharide pyruvyl transferase family protein [Aquiluna sp.]MDA8927253.1 polysaccharide pyruvyl transferase family protein [Aquiluna sp.]
MSHAKKIGFIKDVCDRNPDKMVFWIDVDCRITHLPDYIANSSADLIGFQRSFGAPIQIGYHNRTRFWEPSFWGVNATGQGRKLINDAHELEKRAEIKATDDYFLEEAWRANSRLLTFQMIPTTAIMRDRGMTEPGQHPAFFSFGSSGNVADFKDKVVQHGSKKKIGARRQLLRQAKKLERLLPAAIKNPLRSIADSSGVTGLLTQGRATNIDPARATAIGEMLNAGINGRVQDLDAAKAEFEKKFLANNPDQAAMDVAASFLHYSSKPGAQKIPLNWWAKPFPGNFGDWLSPLMLSNFTDNKIIWQPPTKPTSKKHLVSIGSIGRFIKPNSVVVGTGISSEEIQLSKSADYISVRGPLTAAVLAKSGGKKVDSFGDPGLAISEVIPLKRSKTNGKIAFIRHFSHLAIPVKLPENFDELSVLLSHPDAITTFLKNLIGYDSVVTSAMHIMIACQSYGIPCALVSFEGFQENVHGTGIKYQDYALGAGVEVMNPEIISLDLNKINFDHLIKDISVSAAKKLEVVQAIKMGISRFDR